MAQIDKGNKDLHTARANAADEFYTAYEDVSAEMSLYGDYFRDKHVYCPCDNAEYSSFYKYFKDNFKRLGLLRLTATAYTSDEVMGVFTSYDGENEEFRNMIETTGDFRSKTILRMISEADIIVTNPPFSLFREFIDILTRNNKDFIILGNINAVTYKEVFPHIVNGLIRLGSSIHSGDRKFIVPDYYPLDGTATGIDVSTGQRYIRVKGVRWFTNVFLDDIEVDVKHTVLGDCYKGNSDIYPKFDTYDAINVNSMKEIPYDYTERIGAPITVIDKMNADGDIEFITEDGKIVKYQIMGMLNSGNKPQFYDYAKPILNGKCKFKRIIIRKKEEHS
mgnify:CR=1 FL=1